MDDQHLPSSLADLAKIVVPLLRRTYDINAARHDPQVGDDGVTFGSAIYRNSWFQLEQALTDDVVWFTARPDGSLTISNGDLRVHVYRCGNDEHTDLDAFRLDDAPASLTKRSIAVANTAQLTLALFDEEQPAASPALPPSLRELVIIHAGNPDDGCCGVWVGAPLRIEETITASPWAWIQSLWQIDRPTQGATTIDLADHLRHDQLPEPDLDIRLADDQDDSSTGEA
jgi:hypothetical protein